LTSRRVCWIETQLLQSVPEGKETRSSVGIPYGTRLKIEETPETDKLPAKSICVLINFAFIFLPEVRDIHDNDESNGCRYSLSDDCDVDFHRSKYVCVIFV
jgi:hypothetical protein